MGEWELFAMGLLRPTDLLGLPLVGYARISLADLVN
jgi:hypothetical protein